MLSISIGQATLDEVSIVSSVLLEAALWLKQSNIALWSEYGSPE